MKPDAPLFPIGAGCFVREAVLNDVPAIAEIWREGAEAAFGKSIPELPAGAKLHDHFVKLIDQQNSTFKFWVCIDAAEVMLGWSTVQPFHTTPLESARNAYGFISTYMGGASRGKGIGGQLLDFVIAYCREHTQIAYVLGIQDRSNLASVRISDKVGFIDLGMLPASQRINSASIIVCPVG